MPQVTPHELNPIKGKQFRPSPSGTILTGESHGLVIHPNDPTITNGSAFNVGTKVFDGVGPRPTRLNVNAPVLSPNRRIDAPFAFGEFAAKRLFKRPAEHRLMQQVIGFLHSANRSIRIETHSGHDAVQMRVEEELLVPCVENGGKTAALRSQPFGRGEFVGKSLRDRRKEKAEGLLGLIPKKQIAQLFGQCKRDHKIWGSREFPQLAFHPLLRGCTTTLRTGFVIATMPRKMRSRAIRAGVNMSAQSRSPALANGVNGTPLCC